MKLKCVGSGSKGNCYILQDNDNQILLLDLGLPLPIIKQALNYQIKGIVGAVITHQHKDHSLSVKNLEDMGIKVFKPYLQKNISCQEVIFGNYRVIAFDLTTIDGKWTHSNADCSLCPCYGVYIEHKEIGKMLYITDTSYIKWTFNGVSNILISCNYIKELIYEDTVKSKHVIQGHMELQTCKDFIKSCDNDKLKNVILCHLSEDNSNIEIMINEIKSVTHSDTNIDYARKNVEWRLN